MIQHTGFSLAKIGNAGARLRLNGIGWPVVDCLFGDEIVLLTESSREFQKGVDELCVHVRRELKVNVRNDKVMVFERKKNYLTQVSFHSGHLFLSPIFNTWHFLTLNSIFHVLLIYTVY